MPKSTRRLVQQNGRDEQLPASPNPDEEPRPTALLSAVLIAPLLISALGHAHCSTRSIVVHARAHIQVADNASTYKPIY